MRGALAVLVEVGFWLDMSPIREAYQRTEGGLQRRAILHRFGEEYAVAFTAANARAQAARGALTPARRPIPRPEPQRAPALNLAARAAMPSAEVAQKHPSPGRGVIMGEVDRLKSQPKCEGLEAALARLRRGMGL